MHYSWEGRREAVEGSSKENGIEMKTQISVYKRIYISILISAYTIAIEVTGSHLQSFKPSASPNPPAQNYPVKAALYYSL